MLYSPGYSRSTSNGMGVAWVPRRLPPHQALDDAKLFLLCNVRERVLPRVQHHLQQFCQCYTTTATSTVLGFHRFSYPCIAGLKTDIRSDSFDHSTHHHSVVDHRRCIAPTVPTPLCMGWVRTCGALASTLYPLYAHRKPSRRAMSGRAKSDRISTRKRYAMDIR